jgi:hypothetical protein
MLTLEGRKIQLHYTGQEAPLIIPINHGKPMEEALVTLYGEVSTKPSRGSGSSSRGCGQRIESYMGPRLRARPSISSPGPTSGEPFSTSRRTLSPARLRRPPSLDYDGGHNGLTLPTEAEERPPLRRKLMATIIKRMWYSRGPQGEARRLRLHRQVNGKQERKVDGSWCSGISRPRSRRIYGSGPGR